MAWERRPENPTGQVMVATGFAWFAHELLWSSEPLPWTIGQLLESTYLLGVGYLLVTFPDGRLHSAAERWIMAMATLSVVPLQIAWLLLGYGDNPDCACPENVFQIADAPGASEAIVRVQQALGAILAVATIVVIARRARAASPSRRLAIAPVLVTGAIAFALLIPWVLNDALGEPLGEWTDRRARAGPRRGAGRVPRHAPARPARARRGRRPRGRAAGARSSPAHCAARSRERCATPRSPSSTRWATATWTRTAGRSRFLTARRSRRSSAVAAGSPRSCTIRR